MTAAGFSCRCGKVTGHLVETAPSAGLRAVCHCADCRTADRYCGETEEGPVGLWQTSPFNIRFDSGLEHLEVFSLSPRGLLRWRAGCCGALLFNTVRSPKIGFAALRTARLADPDLLGPVRAEAFVPTRDGKTRHKGGVRFVWTTFGRILANRISGRWKETPFFDEAGQPVRDIHVLSREERAELSKAPG